MSSQAIRGGSVAIEIGADPKKVFATLNAVQARFRTAGSAIAGLGVRMAAVGAAASAPFALALATTATFQDTMAAVGAVTDATGADFEALRKKALDLGASTSFTAQQVAEGMQALGQGGFSVEETLTGIEGTLLLARAGMLDLGQATGIAVAVLRSFKMPTAEAGKVADILAKAANASNATVSGLGEALSTVGGIAYSAGISLTELSAAVGLLADRGMQGSEAGTALRRVLIGMSQEQDKLRDMGVEVKDPKTGKLKPLKTLLADLRVALKGMDSTDRIAKLSKIFDVFGANAIEQLLNSGDALTVLDEKLQNSAGSAAEVATKMDDTLGGSFRMFESAVEGLVIAIGDSLTKEMRAWLDYGARLSAGLSDAVKRNQEWVVAIWRAVSSIGVLGAAMVAAGAGLQLVAFSIGGFTMALAAVLSPAFAVVNAAKTMVGATASVAGGMVKMTAPIVQAGAAMLSFAARTIAATTASAAAAAMMAGRMLGSAIIVGAAWTGAAVAGLAAFAAEVKARVTYYTGQLAFLVANTVRSTGVVAASWITTAGAALASFVTSAGIGISMYLTSLGAAVAGTLSSVAAMAAAWLAPIAPVLAVAAGIAAVVAFAGSAVSGFNSLAGSVSGLFEPLVGGFTSLLGEAARVFGEIWDTATVTFAGISDAITAGDLGLAVEVLWAGFIAAWLKGQESVMGFVDQMVLYLQNRWGDAVTWIAGAVVSGTAGVERAWMSMTGFLYDNFSAAINSVLNVWDTAVGAIQKAIAYIRSFFDESIDYDAVARQIDSANEQRRNDRSGARDKAQTDRARNLQRSRDNEQGALDILAEDNARAQREREARMAPRAAERAAASQAADDNLAEVRRRAAGAKEGVDLAKKAEAATSVDELRDIAERARELAAEGGISSEQLARIETAIDEQTAELDKTRAMKAQEDEKAASDKAAAEAAVDGTESAMKKIESAGTFSAAAAMQLNGSQSLAERTAKAAEETAKNTKKKDRVAA
jgi:TP901 family phage tail tape measure protein